MKTQTTPHIFLLGGHDLEMLEIKQLLEQHQIPYVDRNLGWGAKLSAYHDLLTAASSEALVFVGIELEIDHPVPPNFLRIDHHNDLAGRPAAILQVITLLDLEPTRWQVLVGANDSGFIPAMQAIGATAAEIEAVRAADRKAQGLTDMDERRAQASVDQNMRVQSGITIVKAMPGLKYFSPITDRLYGKTDRLLCYTDTKLTYYWLGAGKLAATFSTEIAEHVAYHGGGDKGYFGLAEGMATDKIEVWVQRIIEALQESS